MRAWLLLLANATMLARITGQFGPAEFLALGYLTAATVHLYRSNELRAATARASR